MPNIRQFAGKDPNYHYVKYLNEGSFGRVDLVKRKRDHKEFACKVIAIHNSQLVSIDREITALRLLRGCQGCIEWEEDISLDTVKGDLHLHMKYCNSNSLKDFIGTAKGQGSYVPEDLVMGIFEDLVNGIRAFHNKNIVHRDIKPGNIMLHTYRAGEYVPDFRRSYSYDTINAYYVDFGLAKFAEGAANTQTRDTGTEVYMAPESTGVRPRYSAMSDIFSLGCVIFELCELRRPYNTRNKTSVPTMRRPFSPELKQLVRDMMSLSPSSRPSTESLYRRFTSMDAGRKTTDGEFVNLFQELAM